MDEYLNQEKFEKYELHSLIRKNDVRGVQKLIEKEQKRERPADDSDSVSSSTYMEEVEGDERFTFREVRDRLKKSPLLRLSHKAETYLHVAVECQCDVEIVKALIPVVRLGQVNDQRKTALDVALDLGSSSQNHIQSQWVQQVTKLHSDYIMDCIRDGKQWQLVDLAVDGWKHWPVKGVVEIEQFSESLEYLKSTPGTGSGLYFNDMPDMEDNYYNGFMPTIFTRSMLMDITEKDIKTNDLDKKCDVLGMTFLHKAVIFGKDVDLMQTYLNYPHMLTVQDNLGRTPYHYACSYGEQHEIFNVLKNSTKLDNKIRNLRDNKGYTGKDYLAKAATIDIYKVRALCSYITKFITQAAMLNSDLIPLAGFPSSVNLNVTHIMNAAFNCLGDPLLDITGRNLLHKVVICQNTLTTISVEDILKHDQDKVLYKGQDLWGRTALHYAYMVDFVFDLHLVEALTKKKFPITYKDVMELKDIKDMFGKRAEDYEYSSNTERETKQRQENLENTFNFLTRLPFLLQGQQSLMKKLIDDGLHPKHTSKSLSESTDEIKTKVSIYKNYEELFEAVLSITHFDTNLDGRELFWLLKDPNGVPPLHYAVALQNKSFVETFGDTKPRDIIRNHFDFRMRNAFEYSQLLPDWLIDQKKQMWSELMEEKGVECDVISRMEEEESEEDEDEEQEDKWYDCGVRVVECDYDSYENAEKKVLLGYDKTNPSVTDAQKLFSELKKCFEQRTLAVGVRNGQRTTTHGKLIPSNSEKIADASLDQKNTVARGQHTDQGNKPQNKNKAVDEKRSASEPRPASAAHSRNAYHNKSGESDLQQNSASCTCSIA